MKIATSPYQLNYLRQEVKDVRCINISGVKTCHLLRSFSDNFYEESLDRVIGFVLSDHQSQTCAHKLQTTVDTLYGCPWRMPCEGHSPRDSQQVQYFNYARKRSGIHGLREPDIDDDDDDDDDKWMAQFRDNSHRWSSSSNEAAPERQQVWKELVETGLEHQRLFCAKIPDSCYIQPHP